MGLTIEWKRPLYRLYSELVLFTLPQILLIYSVARNLHARMASIVPSAAHHIHNTSDQNALPPNATNLPT